MCSRNHTRNKSIVSYHTNLAFLSFGFQEISHIHLDARGDVFFTKNTKLKQLLFQPNPKEKESQRNESEITNDH